MDAAIFDLEGVLFSTGRYRVRGWQQVCAQQGWRFSRLASGEAETLDQLAADNGVSLDGESRRRLLDAQREYSVASLSSIGSGDLIGEAVGFVMELSNYGVPTAGVTNVPAGGELIRALDLSELLDIAVTDEEAMDTEGYAALLRQATEALSVAPSQCVLFSEGSNAVEAGRSLGLLTIAYGSSRELEAADRRISTFSEVDISELLALGVTV